MCENNISDDVFDWIHMFSVLKDHLLILDYYYHYETEYDDDDNPCGARMEYKILICENYVPINISTNKNKIPSEHFDGLLNFLQIENHDKIHKTFKKSLHVISEIKVHLPNKKEMSRLAARNKQFLIDVEKKLQALKENPMEIPCSTSYDSFIEYQVPAYNIKNQIQLFHSSAVKGKNYFYVNFYESYVSDNNLNAALINNKETIKKTIMRYDGLHAGYVLHAKFQIISNMKNKYNTFINLSFDMSQCASIDEYLGAAQKHITKK